MNMVNIKFATLIIPVIFVFTAFLASPNNTNNPLIGVNKQKNFIYIAVKTAVYCSKTARKIFK